MRNRIRLTFLILVFVVAAFVINIRLEIVRLPAVSLGKLLFGEIGHADGIKVLEIVIVDLALLSIFCFAIASVGLWIYEKRLIRKEIK